MAKSKHSQEALQKVSRRLTTLLDNTAKYRVEKAMMATVLDRRGNYRKEGLLGGEDFRFVKVYPGKVKGLIFCLKPVRPAGYKLVEFTLKDLSVGLEDFLGHVEEVLGCGVEEYLDSYSDVFEEKEKEQELSEKKALYGSNWGAF